MSPTWFGARRVDRTGGALGRLAVSLALAVSVVVAAPAPARAVPFIVQFSAASATTPETGSVTVGVVLTTGGDTTSDAIIVTVSDAGTGDAGVGDYSFTETELTFPAGSTGGAVQSTTVTITPDTDHEPVETIALGLTMTDPGADGASLGTTTTHTISINDNDPVSVGFTAAASSVGEAGGTHVRTVKLTVPGGGTLAAPVTVDIIDNGTGTATDVDDYTLDTASVSFNAGAANGATRNFTVSIVDDSDDETSETVVLGLGVGSGPVTVSGIHTVTINDNDTAGVTITPTSRTVTEGGAGSSYTVVLDSRPASAVTIGIDAANGEVTTSTSSLNFTRGNWATERTVTITAPDDDIAQGARPDTITHSATSSDPDYGVLTPIADVAVLVNDDEVPAVVVSETDLNVTEGGSAATYTVVLTSQPAGDVTITASDNGGELSISPAQQTFNASDWDTPQSFDVSVPDNALSNGDRAETIEHTATSAVDAVYDGIAVASVDVAIADDEGPAVASINDQSMQETDGSVVYTFTISVAPAAAGATSVRVATGPTGANPASSGEFENVTNRLVNIPAGASSVTVDIDAFGDNLAETNETFAVTIASPTGGLTIGDGSGIGTIEDDDDIPVAVADSYSVGEGGTLAPSAALGVLGNDSDADDGQPALTAILVASPASNVGTFILNANGSFTYAHDGSATTSDSFTYRAFDGTNQSPVRTVSITINNVPPVVDAGTDPAPRAEGVPVPIAATFFDPGLADVHTATINWGDGTVQNCPGACSIGFNTNTGNGTVTGSHSYAAMGVYPVTITVDDGPSTGSDNLTVTVQNANLTVTTGADRDIDEGDAVAVNASFIDADGAGSHSATIDWGDGSPVQNCPAACTIADNGDGTGTVAGSHTYTDNGAFTVIVAVSDGSGDSGSGGFTANVANVAPVASINGPTAADEGDSVTLIGVRIDPGNDTYTYAWEVTRNGDLYTTATTKNLANLFLSDDGEYEFTFVATDDDGGVSNIGTHTMNVANVAPDAEITDVKGNSVPNSGNYGEEGVLIRLRSSISDPGDEEFVITWTVRLLGKIVASGTKRRFHFRPTEDGTYFVSYRVQDGDGGSAADSVLMTIDNADPVVTAVDFDGTPAIGSNAEMDVHFSDPGIDDTHTVTVDWGQGSPSTAPPGPSPQTVSHTYTAAGTRTVEVCVEDDDGGSACVTVYVNPGVTFQITSDFDGDGFEDLPIGVPGEDGKGAVNVLYGTRSGLGSAGDDVWRQGVDGIGGLGELGDAFGATLAWGDFDLDGFADLVVGAPGEALSGFNNAGLIHVIYGSPTGLSGARDAVFHQESFQVPGKNQAGDGFGKALAVGDYNGDGFADLAVGVPGEDLGSKANTGRIVVLYGAPGGLTGAGSETWQQNMPGVLGVNGSGDRFGSALAAGDFNKDGDWELAVGVPGDNVARLNNTGAVVVLGGATLGIDVTADSRWHQNLSGMQNAAERADRFGSVLEVGDFNGDGRPDLAVGIPKEDFAGAVNGGAVAVIVSGPGGLNVTGNRFWHENLAGVDGDVAAKDQFGFALAAGDFDDDGRDDLAIGVPFQDVAGKANAGEVLVIYGSSSGLSTSGEQLWNEDTPGIRGIARIADHMGWALRALDQDGDGDADLAIGIPDQNTAAKSNSGAVLVLRGRAIRFTHLGETVWHQDVVGVREVTGVNDRFGRAL